MGIHSHASKLYNDCCHLIFFSDSLPSADLYDLVSQDLSLTCSSRLTDNITAVLSLGISLPTSDLFADVINSILMKLFLLNEYCDFLHWISPGTFSHTEIQSGYFVFNQIIIYPFNVSQIDADTSELSGTEISTHSSHLNAASCLRNILFPRLFLSHSRSQKLSLTVLFLTTKNPGDLSHFWNSHHHEYTSLDLHLHSPVFLRCSHQKFLSEVNWGHNLSFSSPAIPSFNHYLIMFFPLTTVTLIAIYQTSVHLLPH